MNADEADMPIIQELPVSTLLQAMRTKSWNEPRVRSPSLRQQELAAFFAMLGPIDNPLDMRYATVNLHDISRFVKPRTERPRSVAHGIVIQLSCCFADAVAASGRDVVRCRVADRDLIGADVPRVFLGSPSMRRTGGCCATA